MQQLTQLTFLVHAFCYACWESGGKAWAADDPRRPFLAREQRCAAAWSAGLAALPADAALVVVPGSQTGPAGAFYAAARAALGDRLFLLDSPDCHAPAFWTAGDAAHRQALADDVAAALVGQQMDWNKEELHTGLHSHACARQFATLLAARGYTCLPATVAATAWGASFDGCVTKYTLYLRRLLGLARPIEIVPELTVPDAAFLLDTTGGETVWLANGLRLFLFTVGGQTVGLYTFGGHTLAAPPACVTLPVAPDVLTVRSKQGTRLWPNPEIYELPAAPLGYREPPQVVVRHAAGRLHVPVSAGLVYRLAKAPAYVFAPPAMAPAAARDLLVSAELA